MKYKFIHKTAVFHAKFVVLFNLLRGLDITWSRAGPVRGLCTPDLNDI